MPSITERAALCRTFILPRCSIPHSNMPNIHNHKGINPIVCAAMTFLLMLPELFMLRGQIWWEAVVATLFNVCFYAALSYFVCILFSLAKPRVERALHIVCHSFLVGYSLSNVFLLLSFNRHWDAYILQFLCETNARESSEFVHTFILSYHTLGLVVFYALFIAAELGGVKRVKPWPAWAKSKVGRALEIAGMMLLVSHAFFFGSDAMTNDNRVGMVHSPIKRNAIWNLYQSVLMHKSFAREFDRCAQTLQSYKEPVLCKEQAADFVLIIGESFNRHMSNLYDGAYDTNPRLRQRLAGGRLFVFRDVIASDNGTTQNFKLFLSTASVGQARQWCDAPLFPLVLRRCGYNVVFLSNQFAGAEMDKRFNASMGFFNDPRIASLLFDYRGTRTFAYDEQLVTYYEQQRKTLEQPKRNFVIFHLYGQHQRASERFPEGDTYFKSGDIRSTLNLSEAERQSVADYLNATRYNDLVVDHIIRLFEKRNAIVLYFADHGEEVYNYRHQLGRTDLATDVPRAKREQLDVPFLIYLTPSYAAVHSDMVARLRAAEGRPFMTDDLPHVIFDILGVRSREFVAAKSLINAQYQAPRKRLLQIKKWYE